MKIRLIWTGKTRDGWAREAIDKYMKLLRPFAEVELHEVREHKGKSAPEAIREAEGKGILKASSHYILLDERGSQEGSGDFSKRLKGASRLDFVLGGPWGVSDEVKGQAADTVALSMMTMTHEMARVVLLEQIYRGFTIITGRKYHH